ncbi:hypothetical protein LC612_40795, partial [Nostoc sp. CHAB 5834]|nr:hypothetical protein [Nostoc sp. CHAB 5834]
MTDCVLKVHNPNLVFEQVRHRLSDNQYFAFTIVTAENIKASLLQRYPVLVVTLYYPFHFL